MILVVSDVHLGYDKCNRADFLDFLNKYQGTEIDHLVLLGDIFDFWRNNNARTVIENQEVLVKLNDLNAKNVYYIAGNHDYYIMDLNKRYDGDYPFKVSKYLRLEDGGEKFYFTHGYELEVLLNLEPMTIEIYEDFSRKMCFSGDVLGGIASHLWGFFEKNSDKIGELIEEMKKTPYDRVKIDKVYNLAVSPGKSLFLGMNPDENLVFGHTHRPFINKEKTVVNTGSWVDELPSKKDQNSYVEISKGQMELKFF
jgi:UDP-2,3-diacylglucosamine pyrophosphatase LpxH